MHLVRIVISSLVVAVAGTGAGGVAVLAVDDDVGHGYVVGLALAGLKDLLRRLVVDGVQNHLPDSEHDTQPVGDLHEKKTHQLNLKPNQKMIKLANIRDGEQVTVLLGNALA